jgi:serine/threonine-protein kinase SRPK3
MASEPPPLPPMPDSSSQETPPEPLSMHYVLVSDAESIDGYQTGGYHPVRLGDTLVDGQYEIIHKLGFGRNSTIWAARDSARKCLVAIKICISSGNSGSNELEILNLLSRESTVRPERECIQLRLGSFMVDGPNGTHLCIVTQPRRYSAFLTKYNSERKVFPLVIARAMAAQLIFAVEYLHTVGIAHGGEFSAGCPLSQAICG